MTTNMKKAKVKPRDDEAALGGVVEPEGPGVVLSESATTLMASFWPAEQCPVMVHM